METCGGAGGPGRAGRVGGGRAGFWPCAGQACALGVSGRPLPADSSDTLPPGSDHPQRLHAGPDAPR